MNKIYIQGSLYLRKEPFKLEIDSFEDEEFEDDLEDELVDYDSAISIYQLIIANDRMFLRQRTKIGDYLNTLVPVTKEELKDDYIDLSQLLNEDNHVGRKGRMSEVAENGSDMFVFYRQPLVLYASDSHMVLYNDATIYREKTPIEILDSRYCNNWEYFGDEVSIYSEASELYKDLLLDAVPREKILKRDFPRNK